jgi:2-polyprenyl-3-methyl-5-hydroxy-6-metoxy-1,4-benzoquinol methylase
MTRDHALGDRVGNLNLAALGVGPGANVVDVGCGEGQLAELLARAGLHVTGVEPAAYLRERFRERVVSIDPASRVLDGLADRLPFADGEVEHVVTTEVLEHVPDPASALKELRRVLAPGGTLCVAVPTSYTERVFWRLHPQYAANATHERIFTKPELRRLIEQAGFTIERWEGRNFLPAVSWVFHALLRSNSDHTGAILEHRFVDLGLAAVWRVLSLLRVLPFVEAVGNRVWAKSWYVYCRSVQR